MRLAVVGVFSDRSFPVGTVVRKATKEEAQPLIEMSGRWGAHCARSGEFFPAILGDDDLARWVHRDDVDGYEETR